mmetsp:Transcript_8370/g.14186  ORF Transcript_8370/g.14186 Transcript_8370/m.14186 type:complete len:764 (-) Transcript_8370:110-2401(-)
MGVGASIPVTLDEAAVQDLAGIFFDKNLFNELKSSDGTISRDQYLHEVSKRQQRLETKFCDVADISTTSLWEPLLKSSFYHELFHKKLGSYHRYCSADVSVRRILLYESFRQSGICIDDLYCEKSCGESFTKGVVCTGFEGAAGTRNHVRSDVNEGKESICRGKKGIVWSDFADTDPDEVAVHLWTYSMSGFRDATAAVHEDSFYRRVNLALLQDSPQALQSMTYIICGIIHWIRSQSFVPKEDIVLYRGTSVSQAQEVPAGYALKARTDAVSQEVHEASANIFRMPIFVASSSSLEKAQQFTRIRANGVACPIIEYILPQGQRCDSVACVEDLSHFPDEKEWLMNAYSPFKFRSQRLEYLEIGSKQVIKLVRVVQYDVLCHEETFQEFEQAGQDVKSVLLLVDTAIIEDVKQYTEECGYAVSNMEKIYSDAIDQVDQAAELLAEIQLKEYDVEEALQQASLAYSDETIRSRYEGQDLQAVLEGKLAEAEVLRATILEKQQQCARIEADRSSVQGNVIRKTEEIDDISSSIHSMEGELESLVSVKKELELKLELLREQLAVTENEIRQARTSLTTTEFQIELANEAVEAYKRRMAPLEKEEREAYRRWEVRFKAKPPSATTLSFEDALVCVERARKEYFDSVFPPAEMEALVDTVTSLQQQLAQISAQLDELTAKKERYEVEISGVTDTIKEISVKISSVEAELIRLREERARMREELETLQQELARLTGLLDDANKEVKSLIRQEEELSFLISALRRLLQHD